jgi:hypothetical protein
VAYDSDAARRFPWLFDSDFPYLKASDWNDLTGIRSVRTQASPSLSRWGWRVASVGGSRSEQMPLPSALPGRFVVSALRLVQESLGRRLSAKFA